MRQLILLLTVTLAACSHQASVTEAPIYQAAQIEPQRVLTKVVTVKEPLPLPGQLKPSPGQETSQPINPIEHVQSGQKKAAIGPGQGAMINAIQHYPYTEGALYQVYTAVDQVTDIALAPGEQLSSVSAGDTVRWIVGDTVSGSGETARTHILVKPIAAKLQTNLVILTDRRVYHLELTSTDNTYMAAISWHYPREELKALERQIADQSNNDLVTASPNMDISQLDFDYRISGDKAPWRPLRTFDDGNKTYIQFPEQLAQTEAPPLFILTGKNKTALVNYRMRGRFYVVDRLIEKAELRLGEKPQTVVRITYKGEKR